MQKNLRYPPSFLFFSRLNLFSKDDSLSDIPAEYHSLVCNASRDLNIRFPWYLRRTGGNFVSLPCWRYFHRPELRKQRHLKTQISKERSFYAYILQQK